MASDPLPTAFFGPGFSQNTESLTISKSDLQPPIGLSPSYDFLPASVNTAESIFLALYLRASRNQDQSQDSQLQLAPFEMALVYRFGRYQREYTSILRVYQDDTLSTYPNPNSI